MIWEEHYNEPSPNPEVPFGGWEGCWGTSDIGSSLLGNQAGDRVQQLINKMMLDNHVHVLGEGYATFSHSYFQSHIFKGDFVVNQIYEAIFFPFSSRMVGRAAFTGNHQWILANSHIRDAHPPEVFYKLLIVSISM